jgi:glucosamine-6-phosphate deaminase
MSVNAPAADLRIFPDRDLMGAAAGHDIASQLREVLGEKGSARVVFAAAPSQLETLTTLAAEPGIDWGLVTAFHMDEYLGLSQDAPERFGNWLREALFDRVPFAAVHYIDADADPADAIADYSALLAEAPIDIVVLGIGMNGHIAFNDPPVADFNDPVAVKVVLLDETCRIQQVEDGCFAAFDDVPESAITVTIPTLLAASRLLCIVPGSLKAEALRATMLEPISTEWPSTILRTHPNTTIYADADAAALLDRDASLAG